MIFDCDDRIDEVMDDDYDYDHCKENVDLEIGEENVDLEIIETGEVYLYKQVSWS